MLADTSVNYPLSNRLQEIALRHFRMYITQDDYLHLTKQYRLRFHFVARKVNHKHSDKKREKLMKSWHCIMSACGLLLIASAITVDAQRVNIANTYAEEDTKTTETQALKCPKCQGDLEQGFILDIQNSSGSIRAPADWVMATIKGGFLPGLKVKTRRKMVAYRCTSCGYVELYAH
jgi:predicted nucleic-acid-binding Zn-ribbon protein